MHIEIKSDYPANAAVRALCDSAFRFVKEDAPVFRHVNLRTGDRIIMGVEGHTAPVATVLAVVPVTITDDRGELPLEIERFPLVFWTLKTDDSMTPFLSIYDGSKSWDCCGVEVLD